MMAPDFPRYHYRGTLARVIDGDTADFDVELGFGVGFRARVRLIGYNAPELHGPDPEKGAMAREYLSALLQTRPCYLATARDSQSFARYLAVVRIDDAGGLIDVADLMRANGFDVPQGG